MKIPLNYAWKYVPFYQDDFLKSFPLNAETIDIPHINKTLPFSYYADNFTQFISSYEKEFEIESVQENYLYQIIFEGFSTQAKIYLNGEYLGNYTSGFYAIKVDITKFIKVGLNRIVVIVDSSYKLDVPPFGGQMDYYPSGGIYREVFLEVHPKIYLENIRITGTSTGAIFIKKDLFNPFEEEVSVEYELFDRQRSLGKYFEDEFNLENITLWDIDNPYLYTLKVSVKSQYGMDISIHNVGFRDVKFTKDGFYLNDKHLLLRGLNRHQAYPYIGYAMPKSGQESDVNILKNELFVNIVRSSHYPPSRHFLNRCDEVGLLVFIEVPGWQHLGKSENWENQFTKNVTKMIKEHFNHPSLILWGVRINESQDHHLLYKWANEEARSLDPFRQTGGVRFLKNSELLEDVYTYNDFLHNGKNPGVDNPLKVYKKKPVPYLITEYNGHMFPSKSIDSSLHRLNQVLRHYQVLNDSLKYPQISGVIGWVMNDYNTTSAFGSGDHICHHGVLDSFRLPKYAAYAYASQQDKTPVLEVLSPLKSGDNHEAIRGEVYVASNVEYLDLYMQDKFIQRFYPEYKKYPYLKHPPFKIDDFIGESIYKDKFKRKDADTIKKLMNLGAVKGLGGIPWYRYIRVGLLMVKYRLKYADLIKLWFKYVNHWGDKGNTYTFVGYQNNQEVIRKTISDDAHFSLKARLEKDELIIGDSYDVTSLIIRLEDEHQNLANYANLAVKITVSEEIEVLGPSMITLMGGQTRVYIRSKKVGIGQLTVSSEFYDDISLKISVK